MKILHCGNYFVKIFHDLHDDWTVSAADLRPEKIAKIAALRSREVLLGSQETRYVAELKGFHQSINFIGQFSVHRDRRFVRALNKIPHHFNENIIKPSATCIAEAFGDGLGNSMPLFPLGVLLEYAVEKSHGVTGVIQAPFSMNCY